MSAHVRTASVTVAAYYIGCPHCHEALKDPRTGSYMIGVDSVDAFRKAGMRLSGIVPCQDCGGLIRLPAPVLRLAGL